MAQTQVKNIRNIAFGGHGSSGKTTLIDKILVKTGAVTGQHSVDDGSSICDFDPEEKHHKYTIESSVVHCDHAGHRLNIIDTPGYPDYIGQTIGALRAVDTALIVVNAHTGIEVNTRRVFNEAGRAGVGRMIVISKMDGDNIDFPALIESIREMWGPQCVLFNVPIGHGADFKGVVSTLNVPSDTSGALVDPNEIRDPLLESIIEVDEAVMERYFEGTMPTDEELAGLISRAVAGGTLIPIVCVSGKTEAGLTELLDAIVQCGLSPAEVPRTASKDGEEITVTPDPEGPVVAQVFKTRIDPFVQKLSFIRVFSGKLHRDQHVEASGARKGIKLGPLLTVQGEHTDTIEEAGPGDIVAIAKMDDLHTGTTLGDYQLPPLKFPTPMVGLAVLPKSRGDETKLSTALHKVVEEDPTFHLDRDAQTKELVITGMSELHLTIIRERLARRDKLEVETKEPKIPFRETIQTEAEGSYRHKKQSGGRGQFGEVHIRMYPFPRGTKVEDFVTKARFPQLKDHHYDESHNFLWVDSVVGGTIPGNFMPAIQKGFMERLESGVIAGYRVQDVAVEVHFGKHHPVDSSEAAFKTAGRMVFRQVFEQAKPALLEPVVKMDITVPEANVGDVYSDMSGRGGRVSGSEAAGGGLQTVHVEVPLRSVTTYARTLSSMTGGQGSYSMDFSHYDVMPANVQQEIISKSKVEEEEED
ncbi:MAG: elongation factor G [Pirellulaceae bacterium]|nr:elongation factor G [Planctomycetales bacterium]MCA9163402.1 elongation factor G [Planctomycetales bacterium]MCA9201400.1 elongation factor G [Planctomycetales bacterium]MCA9208740.1 elongation factor G [Planctomycetales bacterium]MCA9219897.1 elongation factor G [Planctomycetales bacterium]